MILLKIEGLSKSYGAVTALSDVNLEIPTGTRTAVVGASGSGKTTLLRLIAGFERPDAGSITLDGRRLADSTLSIPAHRRGIGIVTQDGALFPHLTIGQNIGFGIDRRVVQRKQRIHRLMDMVELDYSMRDRRPHEISGGQQQRVALARALAREPRLMLLDEPFSALDAALRDMTRRSVAAILAAAGITTILVTHDQAEALSFADQIAVLRSGHLAQIGSPRDLYLRPSDPEVANFIGSALIVPAQLLGDVADCVLGRIPIDATERKGLAQIMVRPEQVRLVPSTAMEADAVVTDVEFAGSTCLVSLSSAEGKPGEPPLSIRTTNAELQPIGTPVKFSVIGKAHVFGR